jgi:hypothetical protein
VVYRPASKGWGAAACAGACTAWCCVLRLLWWRRSARCARCGALVTAMRLRHSLSFRADAL